MPVKVPQVEAKEYWVAPRQYRDTTIKREMFCVKPAYELHLVCQRCANMYQYCTCPVVADWAMRAAGVGWNDRVQLIGYLKVHYFGNR